VKGEWEGSLRVVERMALMWGAAERSDTGELEGPAVITRLPFAVHLTAASWACGGVMKPAFRLTHARGVIADVRRRNRPNVDC